MQDIYFDGQISRSRIEGLLTDLRKINAKQRVWINSLGGTFEFFSILGPPLLYQGFTAVGRDVRSAAIVLYLLGYRRYAIPGTVFFFHEVRAIMDGCGIITIRDLEEVLKLEANLLADEGREVVQEQLRRLRNAQSWTLSFIQENTGLPRATFLDLMRSEAVLSAKEAVRYRVAHKVVSKDELLGR